LAVKSFDFCNKGYAINLSDFDVTLDVIGKEHIKVYYAKIKTY